MSWLQTKINMISNFVWTVWRYSASQEFFFTFAAMRETCWLEPFHPLTLLFTGLILMYPLCCKNSCNDKLSNKKLNLVLCVCPTACSHFISGSCVFMRLWLKCCVTAVFGRQFSFPPSCVCVCVRVGVCLLRTSLQMCGPHSPFISSSSSLIKAAGRRQQTWVSVALSQLKLKCPLLLVLFWWRACAQQRDCVWEAQNSYI